jgi:hypothetical protein
MCNTWPKAGALPGKHAINFYLDLREPDPRDQRSIFYLFLIRSLAGVIFEVVRRAKRFLV